MASLSRQFLPHLICAVCSHMLKATGVYFQALWEWDQTLSFERSCCLFSLMAYVSRASISGFSVFHHLWAVCFYMHFNVSFWQFSLSVIIAFSVCYWTNEGWFLWSAFSLSHIEDTRHLGCLLPAIQPAWVSLYLESAIPGSVRVTEEWSLTFHVCMLLITDVHITCISDILNPLKSTFKGVLSLHGISASGSQRIARACGEAFCL